MRCIYCNTPLAAIDYCPGCGADVTITEADLPNIESALQ